eukprot:1949855-Rhodomonas_salina.3
MSGTDIGYQAGAVAGSLAAAVAGAGTTPYRLTPLLCGVRVLLIRRCHAVSSTDIGCAATRRRHGRGVYGGCRYQYRPTHIALRPHYAMSGTDIGIWRCPALLSYEKCAMKDTNVGYAATRRIRNGGGGGRGWCRRSHPPYLLRVCYAMSGTDTAGLYCNMRLGALSYYASAVQCPVLTCRLLIPGGAGVGGGVTGISLCTRYAMPGTDTLHGGTASFCSSLRACYAMSGTDVQYGATRHGRAP